MPIIVNLDIMLATRKMSLTQLSEEIGISIVNLSILKKSKFKEESERRKKRSLIVEREKFQEIRKMP